MRSRTETVDVDSQEQTELPTRGAGSVDVLVAVVVALVVAGLLSSGRLVDMAARKPLGTNRDRWVEVARLIDDAATSLGADRPADEVALLLDRPEPGSIGADGSASDESDVVLGDLAASGASTTLPGKVAPTNPAKQPTSTMLTSTVPTSTVPTNTVSTNTVPTSTTSLAPTAPPTTARQLRTVTADEPLRIWMGGDSLGEYIVTQFLSGIAPPEFTEIVYDYNIATGLTRPDGFDWFGQLSTQMIDDVPPEAIVWMVGGNDNQDMLTDAGRVNFPSEEWEVEYRVRVGTMMDITGYPNVQMIWIGLPPMNTGNWITLAETVNPILEQEAASRPWVTYIDIWDLFLDETGSYNEFIVGPDGDRRRARAPDGVHITRSGSEWVADLAWAEIERVWQLPDRDEG